MVCTGSGRDEEIIGPQAYAPAFPMEGVDSRRGPGDALLDDRFRGAGWDVESDLDIRRVGAIALGDE